MTPLPGTTSKTVPSSAGKLPRRCHTYSRSGGPTAWRRCCCDAEEIAVAVHDQTAGRIVPVGAVERSQGCEDAAALHDLEHRAVPVKAAQRCGDEEIAAAVADYAAFGGSVPAPLLPLHDTSVVMTPLPWTTSKTEPTVKSSDKIPPDPVVSMSTAVPKRSPLPSTTRPPAGMAPFAPLNEARVAMVMTPLPCTISKTVPSP